MKKIKLKPFNYKKELKKVQGKGIHSKKFKYVTMFSIIGVSILSIFIYRSMAMYSFSSERYSAFKTTTSKKIKITVSSLKDKILASHSVTNPITTPGTAVSASNEAVLASAEDDYGTSYYFRGAITDNYVSLAGFTWRIVRINGDGSVRLILNDNYEKAWYNTIYNANKYVGYSYDASSDNANAKVTKNSTDSTIKKVVDKFYEDNLKNYENLLSDTLFCNDRSLYSGSGIGTTPTKYGALGRRINKTTSLKCEQKNDRYTVNDTTIGNGALKYPIGLLTYDELVNAGANYQSTNQSYYLYRNTANRGDLFFTMSPGDYTALTSDGGGVTIHYSEANWSQNEGNVIHGERGVRPVINLKSGTIVSGSGTNSAPYEVIGAAETGEKTTDYKTTTTIKVNPNSGYVYDTSKGVTCTNGQNGSYNEANNTLTITSPSKDTECTVNFVKIGNLNVILPGHFAYDLNDIKSIFGTNIGLENFEIYDELYIKMTVPLNKKLINNNIGIKVYNSQIKPYRQSNISLFSLKFINDSDCSSIKDQNGELQGSVTCGNGNDVINIKANSNMHLDQDYTLNLSDAYYSYSIGVWHSYGVLGSSRQQWTTSTAVAKQMMQEGIILMDIQVNSSTTTSEGDYTYFRLVSSNQDELDEKEAKFYTRITSFNFQIDDYIYEANGIGTTIMAVKFNNRKTFKLANLTTNNNRIQANYVNQYVYENYYDVGEMYVQIDSDY